MASKLQLAFAPPASESEHDTGLRFTDILFGFVITQIFVRLQNWGDLQGFVRWQLIVSTVIVLGSWIGFRRSLNRRSYELKFFNIPLFRFILDQIMVLLYFRIANLTPSSPTVNIDPSELTSKTLEALLPIFGLYLLWDIGGLLMSWRWTKEKSKYEEMNPDWPSFTITSAFVVFFAVLLCVDRTLEVGSAQACVLFAVTTALLVVYRWAKDIRSTWRDAT